MTKKSIVLLVLAISFSFQILAQQSATYTSDLVDYQKALALYNNQQYRAAQSMFSSVIKTAEEKLSEVRPFNKTLIPFDGVFILAPEAVSKLVKFFSPAIV